MKIGVIKIYPVLVPLHLRGASTKCPCSHSTNIVIEICDAKNRFQGFGEGYLPSLKQHFLEDWKKIAASFLSMNTFPWNLNSIYEIQAYVDSLPPLPALNPIVCAVETALLDLLGRRQDKPLSAYFPSCNYTGLISYTASIPERSSKKQAARICRAANRLGVREIRLGVNGNARKNLNRIEAVTRQFDNCCTLSLDPGCSWNPDSARRQVPLLERFPVRAIEDPMPDLGKKMAEFSMDLKSLGIKLIAGRSAATLDTAAKIIAGGLHDAISIQLSRSGGFHRSLRLINYLRRVGHDFQLGCHPAEGCTLSAAGHVLNTLCNDAINRQAGGSQFLAGAATADGFVHLSQGGAAAPSPGTGLGNHVNRENITRLQKIPALTESRLP